MRGHAEESDVVKKGRSLRQVAQLYAAACLTDGNFRTSQILNERGAALEAMALEYADAVRKEKRGKR